MCICISSNQWCFFSPRFDFNFIWTPYRVILGIVKAHKGKFILGGLVLMLVLFVMLFVYAFPGLVAKWMLPF